MIEEIASINATNTGYCHNIIRKSEIRPENLEDQRQRIEKHFEDERKRVQPIYNSKGKLIEYGKDGRHLDVSI
ncbi:hypothetical protein KAJ87_02700 [Candidatus Pacearchaeota archaeon]|nr:hypothetical protein [Candidatus Pacearchaeota archaeon]